MHLLSAYTVKLHGQSRVNGSTLKVDVYVHTCTNDNFQYVTCTCTVYMCIMPTRQYVELLKISTIWSIT